MPLRKKVRDAFVELSVPPHLAKDKEHVKNKPENKDCLARVYLGDRRRQDRQRPAQFFSLRNFNLHIDQMEELGLDVPAFTDIMADALAVLHWAAQVDAENIEFGFGSAPSVMYPDAPSYEQMERSGWDVATMSPTARHNVKRRSVHMWVLDFNRCQRISMDDAGVRQAVAAFYKNDPYYPRPGSAYPNDEALWTQFSRRYLVASKRVLGDGRMQLPELLVKMVISEGAKRLARREDAEKRLAGM